MSRLDGKSRPNALAALQQERPFPAEQSLIATTSTESTEPPCPADLFGLIPLIRLRIWLRGLEKVLAIAKNPFDTKVVTKGFVGFEAADWNGQWVV